MQKLLVEKYLSTPYLPSKALMKLKESEKADRKKHLETYLRVCIRSREVFHAIEFRVFLEIEKNLQIYIDTLEQIRDISDASKPVISSLLIENRGIISMLTSSYDPKSKGVQGFISSATSWILGSKKKQQKNEVLGELITLKETMNGNFVYDVASTIQFTNSAPTCMNWDYDTGMLAIGFENGQIDLYIFSSEGNSGEFKHFSKINVHKKSIVDLQIFGQKGILFSIAKDNSIVATNISKQDCYKVEEKLLKNELTSIYIHSKSSR